MADNTLESATTRTRLAPDARRTQLLEVASALLFEKGVEAVRIPEVAERAGVTRPVVYRFFPSRQAIFIALLEDLGDAIDATLERALERAFEESEDLYTMVKAYVDTLCDCIESRGPGAWLLLGGVFLDEEVHVVVVELERRLAHPWTQRIGRALRRSDPAQVKTVTAMLVASSRATLGLWIRNEIDREMATVSLSRAVGVIMREFRAPADEQAPIDAPLVSFL